ncbi:gene transfer agent protein [Defluviimonas sp. 20V17]|uniref:Phage host specificity protein n=1 Tax=Allgaiera indica TaxID=765699 RepID=A0AAN4ZYR7_9RHOB|nr:glycoside hydrolase/phage tail family protein [Allgaiera indica]KDB03418.1 gene transfer agent protein [Defluviimonas sp. 20V17]GHE00325.1 phage host specificity protein [Allgaiera indica]SDW63682.1 Putative phage tail protein [Allgaiera indica]
MATIVLSAVGSALGAGFGGTVLGLSGAVIGRAVGATLGRVIDQRLLGAGSDAVETGRVDRFRLMGASEGAAIARVWGRTRLGGQVIWASGFREQVTQQGGGKGAPQPAVTEYSYSVSLAVALCEGEIAGIGRIWADGVEVAATDLPIRVYLGGEDQLPDAKIEAIEGAGKAPAYRGLAYVVFEDLPLAPYGNRVPQFSFEVIRPVQPVAGEPPLLPEAVQAVALIPGTGEYALATTPVHYGTGPGAKSSANVHVPGGRTDFSVSLDQLETELPNSGSVSLVVSWFGDDLRCGQCSLRPKVEQTTYEGQGMAWRAGGITRTAAQAVAKVDGKSIYGGTPADGSVVEAIQAIRAAGREVMFYPFVLMEQLAGNGLADPYGEAEQPALPWRGRITLDLAPGQAGSADGTVAAEAEVAAFFGAAAPADFSIAGGQLSYAGPAGDWGYRRFILSCAWLAKLAGGVDAFCLGSEMRGLSRVRGAGGGFPFAEAMRTLAADVRAVLGAGVKLTYAADWSEYGSHVTPEGDLTFPLDTLWADDNIDFIGIDNYLPISDWRDGPDHADAEWGSIYNLDYLMANIGGGEYFDWYYESPEAAELQIRTPITDGAYGEPWVYRTKDIRGWWENVHFPRPGGVRAVTPTPWVPGSKPIRFTEIGCAAIDKGTNQPNKFLDVRSSESGLPRASRGTRDDLIQQQYLRAMAGYWGKAEHNPASDLYPGPMVETRYAHVWAWDARPFPAFPNQIDLWSDGDNYARGHWLTGRATAQPLGGVVRDFCAAAGVAQTDVSRLYGLLRGYVVDQTGSAREALQPLSLVYGFDATERGGALRFRLRDGLRARVLDEARLALTQGMDSAVETQRAAAAEVAGRVRLTYVGAGGDFDTRVAEAVFPQSAQLPVSQSEAPLVLTGAEARQVTERWLAEARVARDSVKFALPPSDLDLGAGDVVSLRGTDFRIDRVEEAGARLVEAVRVEPGIYIASDAVEERVVPRPFTPPVPVFAQFLDLPLLTGKEVPYEPHLAVTATPWPGTVACYSAAQDAGYQLNKLIPAPSVIGETLSILERASAGLWDRGPALRVKVYGGGLASAAMLDVLNGANVAAIGDGSSDNWEVFQFAEATLVAPDTYDLALRLRGQAGSDALMPAVWPIGSRFVLLNGAAVQPDLALSARGLARHYRIGAAARPYDDPSYLHEVAAFEGIGLRPYAPCHLGVTRAADGAVDLRWIRRTRIDGDSWNGVEVPLGEAREAYLVRVIAGGAILRDEGVAAPGWSYSTAAQTADGVAAPFTLSVAQVSDSFGPGPFAEVTVAT